MSRGAAGLHYRLQAMQVPNAPVVDVVVVSYNSGSTLRACVVELAASPYTRVIVADNASTDDSLAVVADLAVETLALRDNRGFAAGCNAGWRAGEAPYVLFLNPDATIDVESIQRLVAVLERDGDAGAVAPKILESDGSLDYSLRRFPRVRSTLSQAFFLHRLFPRARWTDEVIREPERYERAGVSDWVSGACVLVRRDVLEQLDGLDEGFFMYCEDKDLCRRIWSSGREVRYEPSAVVVHHGGVSAPRASLLPVMAASRIRYARKHLRGPFPLLERLAMSLLALTHVVVSRGGRARRAGHAAALLVALGLRSPAYPRRTSRPTA
jgi:N-acetylglucosaminyl-diphospho-decaprenol L-rhamnosyltransferase